MASWLLALPVSDGPLLVTLSGDLGAGKTTLVQTLGRQLGVQGPITSPTFTIMKQYPLDHEHFGLLVHIDLYRIESVAELEPLDFDAVLKQPRSVACVEWPERVDQSIFDGAVQVKISILENDRRQVEVVTKQ